MAKPERSVQAAMRAMLKALMCLKAVSMFRSCLNIFLDMRYETSDNRPMRSLAYTVVLFSGYAVALVAAAPRWEVIAVPLGGHALPGLPGAVTEGVHRHPDR